MHALKEVNVFDKIHQDLLRIIIKNRDFFQ